MGTTLVTYVGLGFEVPDDVLESLGDDRGDTVWQAVLKYDLLDESVAYSYDFFGQRYIYIKRFTETYYGAHFSGFVAPQIELLSAEEWEQIAGIQEELGFRSTVTLFVATSIG